MRHLWSLLAGVVAAPLAWLLIAAGQTQWGGTVAEWTAAGRFDTADLIVPGVFLAAAGIVLGLLATLRVSPLGPLVAGLLLLVPTIGMFINPFEAADLISDDDGWVLLDQAVQPRLPVANGTLLLVAALLLMAVFSAHRWRRWPVAAAPVAVGADATPAPAAAPVVVDDRPEPAADADAEPSLEQRFADDLARDRDEAAADAAEPEPEPVLEPEPRSADDDAPDPADEPADPTRREPEPARPESPWSAPPGGTAS